MWVWERKKRKRKKNLFFEKQGKDVDIIHAQALLFNKDQTQEKGHEKSWGIFLYKTIEYMWQIDDHTSF